MTRENTTPKPGLILEIADATDLAAERGLGVGRALFEAAATQASLENVRRLYLLTTTAREYFLKLGFEVMERESAPPEIRHTAEFASLCPSTAVCMRMTFATSAAVDVTPSGLPRRVPEDPPPVLRARDPGRRS